MTESSSSEPPNKFETLKKAMHDFLHEKNAFTSVFEIAEKYTKIDRLYLFLGKWRDDRYDVTFTYVCVLSMQAL